MAAPDAATGVQESRSCREGGEGGVRRGHRVEEWPYRNGAVRSNLISQRLCLCVTASAPNLERDRLIV